MLMLLGENTPRVSTRIEAAGHPLLARRRKDQSIRRERRSAAISRDLDNNWRELRTGSRGT